MNPLKSLSLVIGENYHGTTSEYDSIFAEPPPINIFTVVTPHLHISRTTRGSEEHVSKYHREKL